jgi:hypothetical protein
VSAHCVFVRRCVELDPRAADNPNYQRYRLHRSAVVLWNVVAALAAVACFQDLVFSGGRLRRPPGIFNRKGRHRNRPAGCRGLGSSVYGVPAYSTLGWMNWAGGDTLGPAHQLPRPLNWRGWCSSRPSAWWSATWSSTDRCHSCQAAGRAAPAG